jgi:hypothetical protein
MDKPTRSVANPRFDKFRDAARRLSTDDDPERLAERVKKLANAKPAPADKPMKVDESPAKRIGSDQPDG